MRIAERVRLPRALARSPIKFKILALVVVAFSFPFVLNVILIRANHRAVEAFAEDVDLFAAINRLKTSNESNLLHLENFLKSGMDEDLSDYNVGVDSFVASLKEVEERATDLEIRFLLHAIRNSFVSLYDEAHAAIRARITGNADPYAAYYRTQRIERYLDGYISMVLDRSLVVGTAVYRSRVDQADFARRFAAVVLLLVAAFCLSLGAVFSDHLTVPIRNLAAATSRMAAGDLAVDPVSPLLQDEVGALADSFNSMSAHIAALVADLKEKAAMEKRLHREELKAARAEKLRRESEFLALQARIHPHFLFNTLNSISRDIMFRSGRDAGALVDALSALLRYGLDRGGGVSTLEAELEIVRQYALIQEYRFRDRIAVDIDCRVEDPASVRLPAFSIQPLVENAYIHGLEPKVAGGRISVVAERRGTTVAVTVADDGIGMNDERIDAIRHRKELSLDGHLSSIGLSNVRDRLRLFTGDPRCFGIRSSVATGTVVEILLREHAS
jgi:sensor histidine kinase YesM